MSLLGALGLVCRKIIGAVFGVGSEAPGGGGGPNGGAPPPVHEYMGSEVNLLSANKNQEGKGAGGSKMGGDSTDAWLGAMPGLKQFGPIFQGQTNSETDGESSTESETNSEATSETETKSETSSETSTETEVKADAETKTETESKSDAENETAANTDADSEGKSEREAASSSE